MAEPPRQTIQDPEWEHEAAGDYASGDAEKAGRSRRRKYGFTTFSGGASGISLRRRIHRAIPPDRKYLGLKRKWFFVLLAGVLLALLALIVGLAVGLSRRRTSQFLPLPSDTSHFKGDLTYYDPGLGSCGIISTSSDDIVAVSHYLYDAVSTGSNPNANPLCGKRIRATRRYGGADVSVDLKVVDRCTGCQPTDIDVSMSVFERLADPDQGRVLVDWAWLD